MIIWFSVFISSDGGVTKAVDKRPHYVGVASLPVFGGNFVLAKVHLGLISVHCLELRGVRFSEVQSVLVLWGNQGAVRCIYRGCPLFGWSVIRGFTVVINMLNFTVDSWITRKQCLGVEN